MAVNLICVGLLRPRNPTGPDTDGDLNLSAAHLHLSADAVVSGLALVSLIAGRTWHLTWLDPLAAVAGALLVCHFAWRLLGRTGAALLDVMPSQEVMQDIRGRLENQGTEIIDLHVWRLGPGNLAAILVLRADRPESAKAYRRRLDGVSGLSHITIEVRKTTDS
ncbi:MAG: hypothetical protein CGW95_05080 [Phenylobacterium zucineum]|nr:MAG: hypothetical protein CGW95_05080 [Phenylobacterium zucineum]